jgi:hypothetical protein
VCWRNWGPSARDHKSLTTPSTLEGTRPRSGPGGGAGGAGGEAPRRGDLVPLRRAAASATALSEGPSGTSETGTSARDHKSLTTPSTLEGTRPRSGPGGGAGGAGGEAPRRGDLVPLRRAAASATALSEGPSGTSETGTRPTFRCLWITGCRTSVTPVEHLRRHSGPSRSAPAAGSGRPLLHLLRHRGPPPRRQHPAESVQDFYAVWGWSVCGNDRYRCSPAERDFGFRCVVTGEEGLAQTIAGFRAQGEERPGNR